MKLLRYGEIGREKPGILDPEGVIRDLSAVVGDIAGDALGPEASSQIKGARSCHSSGRVEGKPRLGAPVGVVPKFLGIGLNYRDHAEETGSPFPKRRSSSRRRVPASSGPYDPIFSRKASSAWISRSSSPSSSAARAKNVTEADALDYVAGYMHCDDVSERSLQKGGPGEWIKAKSHDSFGPLGPWLVTTDEVPDPQALDLALDLNGTRMQTGNTSTMIFSGGVTRQLYQQVS